MKTLRIFVVIILAVVCTRTATATTATVTIVYDFGSGGNSTNGINSSLDGSYPVQPPIQGTDGNFYGTTFDGGTDNDGTVYMLTPQGTLTTLYSFQGFDGVGPRGLLFETNGLFYGTTQEGGANITVGSDCCGTVFTITPQGTFTTVHSLDFNQSEGDTADSGLVPTGAGDFFGTTYGGGNSNNFFNGTNATDSFGDGVQNPPGTVYRITPEGTLTTLHSFNGTDGSNPGKEAVVGLDGNLYGTTLFGGASNAGSVYSISSAGTFSTLYSFTDGDDGAHPKAQLLQGNDGNFYGTTLDGGGKAGQRQCSVNGCGTVFKITPQGTLTTLHDFNGDPEPAHPGSLTQGTDGNFYGTSFTGGKFFLGTIYSISPQGNVITLYEFDATNGTEPIAGLTLANDGSFYGATTAGGTHNQGVIFRMVVDTNCTVAVTPANASITARGGSKSITVKADSDCSWSASTTNSFITITAGASGVGNGKVTFTVPANTNFFALNGAITIKNVTFPVTQAIGGCTFRISPKNAKIKVAGGAATVKVTPKYSDCVWSASTTNSFITLVGGGTNITGKGAVTCNIASNATSSILTGTVTVAGQTFTVIQAPTK
jgi:uncharacterized repeat protein (TIGR03803 family)